MPKEAPIEIPRHKGDLKYYLGAGIVFALFGLWMFFQPSLFIARLITTTFIAQVVGVVIAIASGIYIYILSVRMTSELPALVISREDIYDHTGSPVDGLIPWKDVESFKETRIGGRRYLSIMVRDPNVYIDRGRTVAKRRLLARYHRLYGSPIQIPAAEIAYDLDQLLELLSARLRAAQGATR